MHAKVLTVLILWVYPVNLIRPQTTLMASIVISLFFPADQAYPLLTFGPSLSFGTWFALRSYVPLLPRGAFFSSWTRQTWKSWRSWQKRISPVSGTELLWQWELITCMSEQRSKRQDPEPPSEHPQSLFLGQTLCLPPTHPHDRSSSWSPHLNSMTYCSPPGPESPFGPGSPAEPFSPLGPTGPAGPGIPAIPAGPGKPIETKEMDSKSVIKPGRTAV